MSTVDYRLFNKLRHLSGAALAALVAFALALSPAPARADDSEIYLSAVATTASLAQPNVLFIIDTSGSMDSQVTTKLPYDATVTYPSQGCSTGRIYWTTGTTTIPACSSSQYFAAAGNTCAATAAAFATSGSWLNGPLAQWNSTKTGGIWKDLSNTKQSASNPVECAADDGVHGQTNASTARYIANTAAGWGATSTVSWAAFKSYNLYTSNYLNWYYGPDTVLGTRLSIVRDAAIALANSVNNVNLGLMRYSNNGGSGDAAAEGGMVTQAIADIATSRTAVVNALNSYTADGWTPMSETMYEAGQYFKGGAVDYGLNSTITWQGTIVPSVAASRQTSNQSLYASPIKYPCQKNFIIFLTDGLPTQDTSADTTTRIRNASFQSLLGRNYCTPNANADPNGQCLDDMAEYLYKADLNSSMGGQQNVTSYFIGFGSDLANSGDFTFLQTAAAAGGGKAFTATDISSLTATLQSIISDILFSSATFAVPSVAVNVFNRTSISDEIYLSVFKPDARVRWDGNLKKYKLGPDTSNQLQVLSQDNAPAIDPATGFFYNQDPSPKAWSVWSATRDGSDAGSGGAASKLPPYAQRNLYSNLSSSNLATDANNSVVTTNTLITDAMLGGTTTNPTKADLISWMRGQDIDDENADGSTTDTRQWMGDPIHSRPAVVTYGGSTGSPDTKDVVVYLPTNEGYLHAVDGKTGQELWAFAPKELLGRMLNLNDNPVSTTRSYGIDGDIRVLKFDKNGNGIIEPSAGESVYLFFGLARGGYSYYAVDVTDRTNPKLLWTRTNTDAGFTQLGKTWSTPSVARVSVSGATQNSEKFVLIFAGGYEDDQDVPGYNTDTTGNGLYIVDALSGQLLWSAGGPGSSANLVLTTANNASNMNNSIPSSVLVIDTDGDRFADRMYVGDMGGRLWRFDIYNGQPPATLVTGGAIARLGAADVGAAVDLSNTRKFYNAPDVALIQLRGGSPYYSIALGSGYRGHPLNSQVHDEFFVVRDFNPFGKLSQAAYLSYTPVLEGALTNITDIASPSLASNAKGWRLELRSGTTWAGEKVLGEALTFNNSVLFTTYTPPSGVATACTLPTGDNKFYAVSVSDGRAVLDLNKDGTVTLSDRSSKLKQGGISAGVTIFTNPTATVSTDPSGTTGGGGTTCNVSGENAASCPPGSGAQRVFWRKRTN
ncbi:MAG: PilC/PilY family type IV pilus protein [Steroidobacteraceae bacterium]